MYDIFVWKKLNTIKWILDYILKWGVIEYLKCEPICKIERRHMSWFNLFNCIWTRIMQRVTKYRNEIQFWISMLKYAWK